MAISLWFSSSTIFYNVSNECLHALLNLNILYSHRMSCANVEFCVCRPLWAQLLYLHCPKGGQQHLGLIVALSLRSILGVVCRFTSLLGAAQNILPHSYTIYAYAPQSAPFTLWISHSPSSERRHLFWLEGDWAGPWPHVIYPVCLPYPFYKMGKIIPYLTGVLWRSKPSDCYMLS